VRFRGAPPVPTLSEFHGFLITIVWILIFLSPKPAQASIPAPIGNQDAAGFLFGAGGDYDFHK
jgi:hypothetical protein